MKHKKITFYLEVSHKDIYIKGFTLNNSSFYLDQITIVSSSNTVQHFPYTLMITGDETNTYQFVTPTIFTFRIRKAITNDLNITILPMHTQIKNYKLDFYFYFFIGALDDNSEVD